MLSTRINRPLSETTVYLGRQPGKEQQWHDMWGKKWPKGSDECDGRKLDSEHRCQVTTCTPEPYVIHLTLMSYSECCPKCLIKSSNLGGNTMTASEQEHLSNLVEMGTLPTNKQNWVAQSKTHKPWKPRFFQQRLEKLTGQRRGWEEGEGQVPELCLLWVKMNFVQKTGESLKHLKQGTDLKC